MNDIIRTYQERFRRDRHAFRRYTALLLAMAMITTLFVNWQLHGVGISMTADYQCGEMEHTHTASCYTKVLVCGYEEGELENPDQVAGYRPVEPDTSDTTEDSGIALYDVPLEPQIEWVPHEHTADCYTEVQTLTCREEEHVHTDDCFDPEDGRLICTEFEHTHDESCYTTEQELTCGLEEGELVEQVVEPTESAALFEMAVAQPVVTELPVDTVEPIYHHHTDACYEEELTCPFPEHHHTVNCLSDPYADVETEDEWLQKTDTTLDGLWADDLLTVAKSQLGYEQSEKNFQLDGDDNVTVRHYTRYGQAYGNPYGEWDVMFLSYCLRYADIPQAAVPQEAGVLALRSAMKGMAWLQDVDGTEAAPGDIVIYQKQATRTVAVADPAAENSVEYGIATLPADMADAKPVVVEELPTDETTAAAPQTTTETSTVDTVGIVESVDEETGMLTVISGDVDGKVAEVQLAPGAVESVIGVTAAQLALSGESAAGTLEGKTVIPEADAKDVSGYVTKFTGTGTKYDADKDTYTTNLRFDFKIPASEITEKGYKYKVKIPSGVLVPDTLLNAEGDLRNESGITEGHYTFIKESDGSYSALLQFNDSLVDGTTGDITGYVSFKGTLDGASKIDDGKIEVPFKEGLSIDVEIDSGTFKDNKTHEYDLTVQKNVSRIGDKLTYEVYVSSQKGTPQDIKFMDWIRVKSSTTLFGAPSSVTVEKQESDDWGRYQDGTAKDASEYGYAYSSTDGKITMKLPQLKKTNTSERANAGRYKITYTFDIPDSLTGSQTIYNTASTVSRDTKLDVDIIGEDEKTIDINREYDATKNDAWYEESTNLLHWQITVNSNHQDIAGWMLTDDMFDKVNGNLSISPDNNYEIVKNADGTIRGVKFKADSSTGANNQTYTIQYTTTGDKSMDDQQVINGYEFKPGSGTGGVSGSASGTVTGAKNSLKKENTSANVDSATQTATVDWKVSLNVANVSVLKAGTVITDDTTKNQHNSKGKDHSLTKAQVEAWNGVFNWNDTAAAIDFADSRYFQVELNGSDGVKYNFSTIDSAPEGTTFNGFTIKVLQDVTVPENTTEMSWSYSTTVKELDKLPSGVNEFYNTVSVNDKKADAKYQYRKTRILKMDSNSHAGNTTVTAKDDTIAWSIRINMGEDEAAHQKLSFSDALPEGLELVSLHVFLSAGGDIVKKAFSSTDGTTGVTIEQTGNFDAYTFDGKFENGCVTFDLTSKDAAGITPGTIFYVDYTCRVPNVVEGKTYVFSNTADALADGIKIGSSSQTQNWTLPSSTVVKPVLTKEANRENNATRSQINYSIEINANGKDLLENNDELTLNDLLKIPYHPDQVVDKYGHWHDRDKTSGSFLQDAFVDASLERSSIKLYYAKLDTTTQKLEIDTSKGVNGEVTGWTWSYMLDTSDPYYARHKIIVEHIPDGTPLIFQYSYRVANNIEEILKQNCSGAELDYYNFYNSITNEADLSGTGYKSSTSTENSHWVNADSEGGVGSEKSYIITKVEKGNYSNALEGAVFQLQVCDNPVTGAYSPVVEGTTFTTNQYGTITLNKNSYTFEKNTLYRLVEIHAPAGYKLPDNAADNALYFYFSDASDAAHTLPAPLPANAVDLSRKSYTAYAENEKDDSQGYELPSTGGTGTLPFTIAGGAMMLTALVYSVRRKRRHERRTD